MKALLNEKERADIARSIGDVETQTAGEVVVHLVGQSERYTGSRIVFAAVPAIVLAEGLAHTFTSLEYLALEAAVFVFFVLWWVLGHPAILRRILSRPEMASAVHRRAQCSFVENRVHRTRDASGVLILIAQLERRVEILADEGIHARTGVEGWQQHVQGIVEAIRAGKAAEGVDRAVRSIGQELADTFPPREDDQNELSDHLVVTRF